MTAVKNELQRLKALANDDSEAWITVTLDEATFLDAHGSALGLNRIPGGVIATKTSAGHTELATASQWLSAARSVRAVKPELEEAMETALAAANLNLVAKHRVAKRIVTAARSVLAGFETEVDVRRRWYGGHLRSVAFSVSGLTYRLAYAGGRLRGYREGDSLTEPSLPTIVSLPLVQWFFEVAAAVGHLQTSAGADNSLRRGLHVRMALMSAAGLGDLMVDMETGYDAKGDVGRACLTGN